MTPFLFPNFNGKWRENQNLKKILKFTHSQTNWVKCVTLNVKEGDNNFFKYDLESKLELRGIELHGYIYVYTELQSYVQR